MAPRRLPLAVPQHPRDLADPVLPVDHLHVAGGDAAPRLLRHHQVPVGPRGDLRQVGDHQHLVPLGHLRQRVAHLGADLAADPLVHLVEHQRRDRVVPREHHLEREHQARQLAARRHLGERLGVEPDVEPHGELHRSPARATPAPAAASARRASLPPGRPSCGSRRLTPRASRSAASCRRARQRLGGGPERALRGGAPGAERPKIHVGGVEQIELRGRLVPRAASTASSVAPYFWVSRKSRSRRRSTSARRSGSSCTSSAYSAASRASSDRLA